MLPFTISAAPLYTSTLSAAPDAMPFVLPDDEALLRQVLGALLNQQEDEDDVHSML